MNILIIYAHPEPSSFNAALKNHAKKFLKQEGHHVIVSDLYTQRFKAVLNWDDFIVEPSTREFSRIQKSAVSNEQLAEDIIAEQKKVCWSDVLLFQFPLWWFSAPAILKGWIDRVFLEGFAFDMDPAGTVGLLKPKKAMISLTTQAPAETYSEKGAHGSIKHSLFSLEHSLQFVGIKVLPAFIVHNICSSKSAELEQPLIKFEQHLGQFLIGSELHV